MPSAKNHHSAMDFMSVLEILKAEGGNGIRLCENKPIKQQ